MKRTDNQKSSQRFQAIKMFFVLEGIVLAFLAIFYISCGQALYSRDSLGNEAGCYGTDMTGELTKGMVVTQTYTAQMDRIDAV